MKGTDFPEATTKLLPPEGMEDSVYALPVWRHPEYGAVISKWRLSWRERLACLFRGYVWLHVWGNAHPPVTLETEYPFQKSTENWPSGWWILPLLVASLILIGYLTWVFFQ